MATIRALLLPLISAGLVLPSAACSSLLGSNDDGNVRVVLSASDQASLAPSFNTDGDANDDGDGEHNGDSFLQRLTSAQVTVASLLARNTNGELIDLSMDLPQTIDLKALLDGKQTTLPAGTLPAGDYDQLVVVMTQVELTFVNGGAMSLTPPGGGWTSIVRVTPFTIVEGQDATIELQFRMGGAFRDLNGAIKFFPDFDGKHRDD